MKLRNKKIKALSIFMSLLMLLSVVTPAVSAVAAYSEPDDGIFNYVSLGASNTNG